tara:strand:+ start:643 stop:1722 length:1080 start_codon:yes stop_codon:yes gene_type:complete
MRVCILGDGLSSLALAKVLTNQNIFVDVISLQKKIIPLNKSRTLGISKSNIEFFNKEIININNIIWKIKKIEVFSENLKDEKLLNFETKDDEIFFIIKNYKLYEILKKSLKQTKLFNEIYYKNNFFLHDNYNLIINTDYFNPITKKFFYKKIIKKYNSFAYTTLIKHEKINNNIACQVFTKEGPLAFLPISNTETSVVYSIHDKISKNMENIKDLIPKYNFKYKISNIGRIDSFELKSYNLRSYYYKNILAFGDLLHRIHPLAGQGFNMTLRDIKILLNIINSRIKLGLELDYSINVEFQNKSRHKNFIFSSGIDIVHEFFNLERKIENEFLSKSVQFFGRNPFLNKMLIKMADKGISF